MLFFELCKKKAKKVAVYTFSPSTHQRMKGIRRSSSLHSGDSVKTATVEIRYIATGGSGV